jgi:hypothetical protein
MRVRPVVLGIAAAAAFSSAALAVPCTCMPTAAHTAGGFSCTVNDKNTSGLPYTDADSTVTDDPLLANQLDQASAATTELALFGETTATGTGTSETAQAFAGDGIKITNLQATMTDNKYVADLGRFAPRPDLTDDMTLYGPDYFSVKLLPKLPKRRPPVVGVGLGTAPSPNAKKIDTAPRGPFPRQWFPEPERK